MMETYNIKFTQSEEGKISQINIKEGDYIQQNQAICVIEGDNVEYILKSPVNGKVTNVYGFSKGQIITKNNAIASLDIIAKDTFSDDLKLKSKLTSIVRRSMAYFSCHTIHRCSATPEMRVSTLIEILKDNLRKEIGDVPSIQDEILPTLLRELWRQNFFKDV